MSNYLYPNGSEWRKWDLHFHTPSSYDYKNSSTSNQNIIDKLKEQEISVIAITDHHIIDVNRIKELKNLANNEITILPGIEFCSNSKGDEPIHFIGIFPETIDLDYIWGELKTHSEIAKQKQEGKKDNEIYCDLKSTSKKIRELGGIVTIHAGSKTNSIESITNSLPVTMAEKKDIAECIDIFELGKKEDEQNYKTIVFPKIDKKYPMIMCSDNHNINDYQKKETCWVKANPTFEGLRQVLFEPTERIKLQKNKPENKKGYQTIQSVHFIDDKFTSNSIPLNQNLNTIVGGRSTGKSLLLRSIAKTIAPEEVNTRYEKIVPIKQGNDVKDFEVIWADGQKDLLSDPSKTDKKILYIPQSYLNRVVDNNEKSIVDEIIENVVKQDDENKIILKNLTTEKEKIEQEINSGISSLFFLSEKIYNQKNTIKEIGDKKGVELEIKKLEQIVSNLKKKAGMNDEEIDIHKKLTLDIENLTQKEKNINDKNNLLLDFIKQSFFENIDLNTIPEEYVEIIKTKLDNLKDNFIFNLTNSIKSIIDDNQKILIKNEEEKKVKLTEIKPLQEKAVKSQQLKEKMDELEKEKTILKTIKEEEETLKSLQTKSTETLNNLIKLNRNYYTEYKKAKDEILKGDKIEGELKLDLQVSFLSNKFKKEMSELFDNRTSKNTEKIEMTYTGPDFFEKIKNIIEDILSYNSELTLKVQYDPKDALTKILQDWFYLDFIIEYEGDKLNNQNEPMSPGKKALVLLKLLIELDQNHYPILLDQPEDDLDNRSIYKDLVTFIKEKKKERQIIIVTHNPNMVVGADSENIIVANQEDKDTNSKNKNKITQFEYVSGALENTFEDNSQLGILYQKGIREHICEILEGGKDAFIKRENKYNFNTKKSS